MTDIEIVDTWYNLEYLLAYFHTFILAKSEFEISKNPNFKYSKTISTSDYSIFYDIVNHHVAVILFHKLPIKQAREQLLDLAKISERKRKSDLFYFYKYD